MKSLFLIWVAVNDIFWVRSTIKKSSKYFYVFLCIFIIPISTVPNGIIIDNIDNKTPE